MPGGSKRQRLVQESGAPWLLTASECPKGRSFFQRHVRPLLPSMWKRLVAHYPDECQRMLDQVPKMYRVHPEVPMCKVTVAINNPTPLHFDDNNACLTMLAAFDVSRPDDKAPLEGGEHVIFNLSLDDAIIVKQEGKGVLILGDYRRVLHANLAVHSGRRFIITAYTPQRVLDRILRESMVSKEQEVTQEVEAPEVVRSQATCGRSEKQLRVSVNA
mmetsp:Transcript_3291/g.9370  ORF Transcript_3291/g.9370 Transcript_3291/m.9370 type:complete len:216 (+) Transcript_3291:183-830(+)